MSQKSHTDDCYSLSRYDFRLMDPLQCNTTQGAEGCLTIIL